MTLGKTLLRKTLIVLAGAAALLAAGCAQNVRSTVTVYQRMDTLPPSTEAKRTYAIVKNQDQMKSLELAQYEDMLVSELGPLGFTQAKANETPRYKVEFNVRSSDQKTTVMDYAYPTFGVGISRGGYSSFGGRFGNDPFFATPIPVQRTYEFVRHELQVRIFDSEVKDPKAVWEGKAVTDSGSDSLAEAMPFLVRSVFTGFPGENGRTRTVSLPRKRP